MFLQKQIEALKLFVASILNFAIQIYSKVDVTLHQQKVELININLF